MAVLLHGVQSAAVTTARTARALAADGWNAIALDMPGHGETVWLDGHEDGERYARANVARLVGAAVGSLGASPVLIGHSWGADTALAVAVSGLPLAHVVLIDPPVMTRDDAAEWAAADVAELRPGDLEAARAVVAAGGWIADPLDAEAKAQALTTISPLAIEAVYLDDAAWRPQADARRWCALAAPPPLDVIAADPDTGGFIPWPALDELRSILGPERVHLLEGAGHSPQRTDFDRLWALLRSILG
jgi:pimeloyl-ACP methyl ester carboxylesterase